ncbi:MAG TPA: integrase arm-type DNA-binding domain-containing protein, partial [Rhizomicrobium sp.]
MSGTVCAPTVSPRENGVEVEHMDSGSKSVGSAGTRRQSGARVRFTPAVLDMRAPKSGRIERRDDLSPLWLRITASGDRSFAVRARIKGNAQPVRITYPQRAHISNLATAREWAVRTDAQCRAGIDPRAEKLAQEVAQAAKHEQSERHDFERIAESFLATNGVHKKNARSWKPRTLAEYERAIRSRLIPRWKGRTIHSITRDEIADFLDEVAEVAPVTANRVLAV